MPLLDVKKGNKYTLKAHYFNGGVQFSLSSTRADWNAQAPRLNENEWNRLVRWIEYQRAEESYENHQP